MNSETCESLTCLNQFPLGKYECKELQRGELESEATREEEQSPSPKPTVIQLVAVVKHN